MLVPFAQPENGVIGVAKSNYYPEVTNYTENCRRLEGPLCEEESRNIIWTP